MSSAGAVVLRADGGDGVAELVFDQPGREVNVLGMAVVDEIEQALDRLSTESGVRALVIRSAKPECFIAGADIHEIATVTEASIAVGHATRVQALLGRLASLPFPVVAAIRGACLGGGLELALACQYRIAALHATTRLGLPEVKLGLIPGFGGTQRLPRLVGIRRALGMVLKGYNLSAADALKAGLVDDALPCEDFELRARAWTLAVVDQTRARRSLALADRLLASVAPIRDIYFRLAERQVKRQTRGTYPAPERALTAMREGLRLPLEEGLEVEAGLVGSLAVSPECKGLVRLFLLSESLKRFPGADLDLAGPVRKAGVLGAGTMGAGITALLAQHEIPVRMRDVEVPRVLVGMRRVSSDLRRARRGAASNPLSLVSPTLELSGFRRADVVIEAALEEMALKRDLLELMDQRMAPNAVFATNTSALSISELQRGSRRPERVVGMHFFHPVARMPLVEVVRGEATSAATVATAIRLARALGKVPIVVADGPGFLVNRVLAPYLMEALLLVMEGVDASAVESAMLDFGMPMGPLELLDEVGLDVAQHVAQTLTAAFPERFQPSPLLASLVADKRLGRKSGVGFYVHRGNGKKPNADIASLLRRLGTRPARSTTARGLIQERLILPMGNEAMRAIEEGIVRNAGDCDLAMVLGTGFPPFRGGLLAFCDSLGVARFLASLERLESQHGHRFQPAALAESLAQRGLSLLDDLHGRAS